MKPATELKLTVAVVVIGVIYFGRKAWIADGTAQLTYLFFVVAGLILGYRAINDVLKKIRASNEEHEDSTSL